MKTLAFGMLLLLSALSTQLQAQESKNAVIYKNEACGHCAPYLAELFPVLTKFGYSVEIRDFINSPEARADMTAIQEKFNVPLQYRGHMLVFLENKYLFEGHVPVKAAESLLKEAPASPVILFQDSMSPTEKFYIVEDGKALECNSDQPLSACGTSAPAQDASLFSHPWLIPLLVFLVPVGFLAKYGFK